MNSDDPSIKPLEAARHAHQWVTKFQEALNSKDISKITNAFAETGVRNHQVYAFSHSIRCAVVERYAHN